MSGKPGVLDDLLRETRLFPQATSFARRPTCPMRASTIGRLPIRRGSGRSGPGTRLVREVAHRAGMESSPRALVPGRQTERLPQLPRPAPDRLPPQQGGAHLEGEPGDTRTFTYWDLHREVCKFANVLRGLGVRRGDRVAIYLPMIPEAAIAMLACTRIGAAHSVVFGGFSPESLSGRINDAQACAVITATVDGGGAATSRSRQMPTWRWRTPLRSRTWSWCGGAGS